LGVRTQREVERPHLDAAVIRALRIRRRAMRAVSRTPETQDGAVRQFRVRFEGQRNLRGTGCPRRYATGGSTRRNRRRRGSVTGAAGQVRARRKVGKSPRRRVPSCPPLFHVSRPAATWTSIMIEALLAPIYLRVLLSEQPVTRDLLEQLVDLILTGVSCRAASNQSARELMKKRSVPPRSSDVRRRRSA